MRRALWTCAAVVLAACSDAPDPLPELHAVTPPQSTADQDVVVEISGAHLEARVVTDFDHHGKSALDATFAASLVPHGGDAAQAIALLDVQLISATSLTARVPAGIPRGEYDLGVLDPSRRTTTLMSAYRVVASAETIAGFRIDPIGSQRARSPFTVSLAAVDQLGRVVDGFSGSATLSDLSGALSPTDTGRFVEGRARVLVTVTTPIASDVLTVTDALGHASIADTFDVKTGLAVALVVRSTAQALGAGECSQPLELELVDVFAEPAQAETPLTLTLASGPLDGVQFFADAACTSSSAVVPLQPGASRVAVHFLTTRSGSPTVRVSSDRLPSASQRQTVAPGSPSTLGFATPGQAVKAGACSSMVEVQVLDSFGNPSPVATALPLSVTVSPAAGASLYADPQCVAPLTSFAIVAGAASSTLSFMGAVEGALHVEITATFGSSTQITSQEETISP